MMVGVDEQIPCERTPMSFPDLVMRLAPSLLFAASAYAAPILESPQAFNPYSRTASAITGPVIVSRSSIVFGNGAGTQLTFLDDVRSKWGASNQSFRAQIFALDSDPGQLLNGNALCGAGDAPTHLAAFQSDNFGSWILTLAVFRGKDAPASIDDAGLCGTFNFAMDGPIEEIVGEDAADDDGSEGLPPIGPVEMPDVSEPNIGAVAALLLAAPAGAREVSFEAGIVEQLRCDVDPAPLPFFAAIDQAGRLEIDSRIGYDSVSCYTITGGMTVRGMTFDMICGFEEDQSIANWSDYFYRGPGTSPGQSLSLLSLSSEAEMLAWARDTLRVPDPERRVDERFIPGDDRSGSEVSCTNWIANSADDTSAPSPVFAGELNELLDAAIRLRQAHVIRSYEKCRSSGTPDAACRDELESLHPREISALARIEDNIGSVSKGEISKATANCHDPSHDYRDLIECWEQLADQLEKGLEIFPAKRPGFQWSDLPGVFVSLDPVQRKSLVLCVRGRVSTNFKETVAHNLRSGGNDAAWALKVHASENYLMVEVAEAAGWSGMQDYYEREARASKKLVRGEIAFSEYRQVAKQNEGRLATVLAPEASRQSVHESNFSRLDQLCDEVALAVIGRAKYAASQ